jgi:hypothetical protein
MFAVYDLTPDSYSFAELRKFADGIDQAVVETRGMGQAHDEKVQDKVDRLADCKIVYLTEIGGPSAARLIKKGIMPIKCEEHRYDPGVARQAAPNGKGITAAMAAEGAQPIKNK